MLPAAKFEAVTAAVAAGEAALPAGALPALAADGLAIMQYAAVALGNRVAHTAHFGLTAAAEREIATPIQFTVSRTRTRRGGGMFRDLAFHSGPAAPFLWPMAVADAMDVAAGGAESNMRAVGEGSGRQADQADG